ncbi:F-box/RNI/FBD-like domain protein [Senna tora]|uniref:F-box/RNI/FBD-like domain protein n=1 Tax=Senna tora TaxID=362788 RepID=A0A834TKP2_9FABA|nr:F-box/RNI/FBD-like domain protein [Senna tora]
MVLINLSSLVDAYVDVSNGWSSLKQFTVPHAIKILRGICNVKSLVLSDDTLEFLSYTENLSSLFPTFHNLTHIRVLRRLYGFNYKALLDILEKSPNLEVINIYQELNPDSCLEGDEWTFSSVPHCFKSSLKSFIISDFDGCATDMQFLNFLLKNATILREITIFCEQSLAADSKKQAEISNQLQIARRGLANCVINIQ